MKPAPLAACLFLATLAQAEPRSSPPMAVTNPREVMIAALASADGTAHGVLQGALAAVNGGQNPTLNGGVV